MRTLAALTAYFDTRLELADRTEPWAAFPVLTPDKATQWKLPAPAGPDSTRRSWS